MRAKTFNRVLFVIMVVLFMCVVATWRSARAQDFQSNDMNAQTAGDVTTGSKNLAIGLGMGDVDINDCMYTKSTPLYQWGTINKWCAADAYDMKGQHDNAARMRCSIRVVKGMYESHAHCIVLNTLRVIPDKPPVVIQPVDCCDDDDEDRHDDQIEQLTEQLVQYGEQQQQVQQRQQVQQQQYEKVQQYEEIRQKKLDLIKQEFGDNE